MKNDFISVHSIGNSRGTELFLPLMSQTIVTHRMLRRGPSEITTDFKFEWLPLAEKVRQNSGFEVLKQVIIWSVESPTQMGGAFSADPRQVAVKTAVLRLTVQGKMLYGRPEKNVINTA